VNSQPNPRSAHRAGHSIVTVVSAWCFSFCPVNRDTSLRARRCAAPKSRHRRVAKRRSFWKGTRSLRGGRSPKPGGRGTRVLNAEPMGAAPAPKRWPSERANRRSCSLRHTGSAVRNKVTKESAVALQRYAPSLAIRECSGTPQRSWTDSSSSGDELRQLRTHPRRPNLAGAV